MAMITKAISRAMKGALGLGSALLLASCYDTKQEFTINPDGSGKVVHECAFQNVNLSNNDDDPKEALQAAIAGLIENSKGIDSWSDVDFKLLDDGRMWFKGTAYFKKLDELEIQNQSMLDFSWNDQGAGKVELALNLKKNNEDEAKEQPADLTPDEQAAKTKAERAKFQQSKPMLSAMLGGLKQSVTFHLPGTIETTSNFKKGAAGALDLNFEGAKMLDALEQLINDDEWLAKHGFDSQNAPELDNEFCGMLFGKKAPVNATVSGAAKPLFNYAAELAAAQAQSARLQKQLGVVSIAPPAEGETLKSVKVVGVRMISEVDKHLKLRPFNYDAGYTLSVLTEFPGSVLDITDKSSITTAIASDGTSLLKGDRDWDRRLGSPDLSADKASAIFDIGLKLPPPGATGLKEITGTIQYRVAGGSKKTDLGLKSFEVGAKGTEFGASIEEIKDGWKKDGSKEMELKLKLKADDLKSASMVVDSTSPAIELDRRGYSSSNGTTRFTFSFKNGIPEKGSIVVETYDQVKTFDVPFSIENLTLLGTPVE